ncbi:uncharacterized protein LOC141907441 isoform X2 [Tubulanus polymorphus]|uniref:uncharacterized protein LOC141907441 isoform X2 n=1 Tax=Tubulanus polymorphus TaxID=672921 RepID=UPI003DA62184
MKIFFIVAVSAALATIATTCTQTQPATTSPPPTTNCPTTPACSAWGDIVPSLGDGDITNGNYYTVIPAQPIMNSLTVGKTLIYDDGTLSGEPEDSATLSGDSQTIYVEFGEVKWVQSLTLAYRQAVSGGAYTINDVTITLLSGDGSTIHSNTDPVEKNVITYRAKRAKVLRRCQFISILNCLRQFLEPIYLLLATPRFLKI